MNNQNLFKLKIRVTGRLFFETAFHIGSGREGELATDMGVLLEPDGRPILPGSTLKGNFRATAERLAGYLGLSACLLDSNLSGENCVSDEKIRKKIIEKNTGKTNYEEFKDLENEQEKIDWLKRNTCDICRLFGSPLQASRIFFSDGELLRWSRGLQVRDGVCIDRDSETARHGAKYDFEVVPRGAEFFITLEIENPEKKELALIGAVLGEWDNGFRLGGFTSRGIGKVRLLDKKIEQVDYTNPEQLKAYLMKQKMSDAENLLDECLGSILNGGQDA